MATPQGLINLKKINIQANPSNTAIISNSYLYRFNAGVLEGEKIPPLCT